LLLTHSIDPCSDRGFIGFENNGSFDHIFFAKWPIDHHCNAWEIEATEPSAYGQFTRRQKKFLDFHRCCSLSDLTLEREHWRSYTKADLDHRDRRLVRPTPTTSLIEVLRQRSDVDLLGDLNGIIVFDAKTANVLSIFECPSRSAPLERSPVRR